MKQKRLVLKKVVKWDWESQKEVHIIIYLFGGAWGAFIILMGIYYSITIKEVRIFHLFLAVVILSILIKILCARLNAKVTYEEVKCTRSNK